MKSIRLFLTDLDGTLTDGGMYYTENGEVMKRFNAHDGMGLQLLQKRGIKVGIITSEANGIAKARAAKLGLDFLVCGRRNEGKLEAVNEICSDLGISLGEVAYIGDDVNCREVLEAVGVAACPADALPAIKALPGIRVMSLGGGQGCVREFADMLMDDGGLSL